MSRLGRTPWIKVKSETEGAVSLQVSCIKCSEVTELIVPKSNFEDWNTKGNYVQVAFPELGNSVRELFISGLCGVCWDNLFQGLEVEAYEVQQ